MAQYRYAVDAQDRISEVGDDWLEFALENDATELTRESVVGRSIWDFVAGMETQHLYEEVFARVRGERTPVTLPFRCDAPDRRRFMQMALFSPDGGGIELVTEILREEPREPISGGGGAITAEPGLRAMTMCSWCKRMHVRELAWLEIEDAVSRLGLFDSAHLPPISHGLCPECAEDVRSGSASA